MKNKEKSRKIRKNQEKPGKTRKNQEKLRKHQEKLQQTKKIVVYRQPRARKKKDSQPGVEPPYF